MTQNESLVSQSFEARVVVADNDDDGLDLRIWFFVRQMLD